MRALLFQTFALSFALVQAQHNAVHPNGSNGLSNHHGHNHDRQLFFPGLFCLWCQNSPFGSGIASGEDLISGNFGGGKKSREPTISPVPTTTTRQPTVSPTTAAPTMAEREWVYNSEGTLQGRIVDGFGTWNSLFGLSPRMDENRLVFGSAQGRAYVYRYNENTGAYTTLEKALRNNDPLLCMEDQYGSWNGDFFGATVAFDGDLIVVGATLQYNEAGNQTGAVYVFESLQQNMWTTWAQTAKISPPQGLDRDLFGFGIAVSGSTIAVGSCSVHSKVWIFEEDVATEEWVLFQILEGPEDSGFGCAVEMNDGILVVSAHAQKFIVEELNGDFELANLTMARGAVHTFERDPSGQWNMTDIISPDEPQTLAFGASLALQGQTLVIGAPLRGGNSDGQFAGNGGLFVYERQDNTRTWKKQANIGSSNGGNDQFGRTLAMQGNRIAMGSEGEGVTLYHYENGKIRFEDYVREDFIGFGSQVALHDDRLAITSTRNGGLSLPGLSPKGNYGFLYQYTGEIPSTPPQVQPSFCPTALPSLPTTSSPSLPANCPKQGFCSTSSLPLHPKKIPGFVPDMSDDGFVEFQLQFDFQWLGVKTIPKGSTLIAYSNGQIGFPPRPTGKSSSTTSTIPIGSYVAPRIATVQTDLNPENGGGVKIDNTTADALTVTYWGVPFYQDDGRVEVQTVLSPDGHVSICFGEGSIPAGRTFAVGIEDPCLGLSFPATDVDGMYGFSDGVATEGIWPYGYCYCFDPCAQGVWPNIVAVRTASPSMFPTSPAPSKANKNSAGSPGSFTPSPVSKHSGTVSPTTLYPTFWPSAATDAPTHTALEAKNNNKKPKKKKQAKRVKVAFGKSKSPKRRKSGSVNVKRNLHVRGT